jgi:hypothetical protein
MRMPNVPSNLRVPSVLLSSPTLTETSEDTAPQEKKRVFSRSKTVVGPPPRDFELFLGSNSLTRYGDQRWS